MKPIYLKPKEMTPGVELDREEGKFLFYGKALPSNAHKFYEDIISWIREYAASPNNETTLVFKFDYLNSTSSNKVSQILSEFERVRDRDKKIKAEWHYEDYDTDMKEVGCILSEVIDIPFEFIIRPN